MSGLPRVSVGLPVYNGERYLETTLVSLLEQSFADFELIVCDNASTDATEDICRRFAQQDNRLQYVRNDHNIGLARNFNRVFAMSRGTYFKWAMADDVVGPDNLAQCVEVLDRQSDVVLAVPGWELINAAGASDDETRLVQPYSWPADTAARLQALFDMMTGRGSIAVLAYLSGLARTRALWRTGLLGSYPMSDQVLLAELALQGRFAEADGTSLQVRLHGASAGNGIGSGDYARVFRTFYPDREPRRLTAWRLRRCTEMLRVLAAGPVTSWERRALQAAFVRGCVRGLV